MKNICSRRHQAGLSMVEAAMACVVLGVAALVLWQYVALQQRQQVQQQSESFLQRAQTALTAYAQLHGRLPCPALDTQGIEACAVAASDGKFPFITVGATDSAMGKLRYHVPLNAPSLTKAPAFKALMPVTPAGAGMMAVPTALDTVAPSTYDHKLDFCAALGVKAAGASAVGASENVAFALAEESGPGSAGGVSGTAAARIVSRGQLRGQLHCAPLVAAGGRAHFNAYLAAATMYRSLQDYQTQFDVGYGLYGWDLGQGVWFATNSAYDAVRAADKLEMSISSMDANMFDNFLQSLKAVKGMAIAVASLTKSAAYTLALTSNVARFSNNLVNAGENRDATNRLVGAAATLQLEIGRNALLSSGSTYFLAEQRQGAVDRGSPLPMPGIYAGGGELWAAGAKYAEMMGHDGRVDTPSEDPLASVCQNPRSKECRAARQGQENARACRDPGSRACQAVMKGLTAGNLCQDPDSDACTAATQGQEKIQSACQEPDSDACKAAIQGQEKIQSACQKPDSDACKAAIQDMTNQAASGPRR
jgi:type II secretory pathway pseudopilin PulG